MSKDIYHFSSKFHSLIGDLLYELVPGLVEQYNALKGDLVSYLIEGEGESEGERDYEQDPSIQTSGSSGGDNVDKDEDQDQPVTPENFARKKRRCAEDPIEPCTSYNKHRNSSVPVVKRETIGGSRKKISWSLEEEKALVDGISKHAASNPSQLWQLILLDKEFSDILKLRNNVDLKDKWRNIQSKYDTTELENYHEQKRNEARAANM